MTIEELRRSCLAAPQVFLSFPGRTWPKNGRIRLLGRGGGPLGQCLADSGRNGLTAVFDSAEVLKFLERKAVTT